MEVDVPEQTSTLSTEQVETLLLALSELDARGISPKDPQYLLLLKLIKAHQYEKGIIEVKASEKDLKTELGPRQQLAIKAQIAAYRHLTHGISISPNIISSLKSYSSHESSPTAKPTTIPTVAFQRERVIHEKIQARIQTLQNLIPKLSGQPSLELPAKIELKKLQQVALQKKVRSSIAPEINRLVEQQGSHDINIAYKHSLRHAICPESIGIGDKIEKSKKDDLWLTKRKHHHEWLSAVLATSKAFHEFHNQKFQTKKRMFRRIQKYQSDKERRESAAKEKLEKDRMAALKRNDETEYLKLLEQTKNKRLKLLIEQTDSYLNQIGEKVIEQQAAANIRLAEFTNDTETLEDTEGKKNEPAEASNELEEVVQDHRKPYYTRIHRVQETITKQPSILVGGELKEYQMDGLSWLVSLYNNRLNGILADEMGLGKTIQTIALICHLYESKGLAGPYLIVVPLTTISNWALEFKKWAPTLYEKLVVYKGVPAVRKKIYQTQMAPSVAKFSVCLTTFDYVIKDRSPLAKTKWAYVIVDEGHRMKNHNCKLSTTLAQYYESQFRIILTGTPLQNSLPELWSLLNFLLPSIFHSVENFEQWFNKPFANTGEKVEMNEEETLLVIQRLHKVLRPFLLRRMKTQVEAQLPEKVERVVKVDMSAWQRRMYDMATKGVLVVEGADGNTSTKGLMNSLMQLRKICNHPYIFNEDAPPSYDDNLWRASGKLELLDRILPKLKACGHRILMFSQFTRTLDILGSYFEYRGYNFLRLDGSTKAEERGDLLAQFNAPDSPYFMFILSTRAGGLGLNLQTADTVILFDSDWNPQADLQAQDRAHRIGQKNDVLVLRLVTINSIEEKILESANFKLDLDSKIIQAGMFNKNSTATDRRNFLMNLLKDNDNDADEGNDVPDNKQINQMISRSDHEYKVFQQMDKEFAEEEKRQWEASGHVGEPVPNRLLQDHEIPDYLLFDVFADQQAKAENSKLQYGRGRRKHTELLSAEQDEAAFLKMIEEEEAGNGEFDVNTVLSAEDLERRERSLPNEKKRKAPSIDSATQSRALMNEIWTAVRDAKDVSGRKLSLPFMDIPTEDIAPGYFTIIKNPMAFNTVKKKIPHYTNLKQFHDDMLQIFTNAHIYNLEGSPIVQDADHLKDIFLQEYAKREEKEEQYDQTHGQTLAPNSQPANPMEPPRKLIVSLGQKRIVSKPIVLTVPVKIDDTDDDNDGDDGFADKDLKGTGGDAQVDEAWKDMEED